MRNKVLTLFALALVILFSNCTSVNAIEYKKDSVPNNSYVIGKHIFTENIVLTTKHIMLGATTIDSNKLTDMTIYYKAPWGDWMDGLSGETINVPDKFDINYIDTVLQVANPVISSIEEVADTDDSHGKKYNFILEKIENMTGVQLYSSSSEDGKYTLVKDYKIEEIANNSIEVEVKGGYNYFYKVKTYKTVSETKYSEFSNVINIDNTLLQPGHLMGYGGYIPKDGEDENLDTVLLFNIESLKTALGNKPDGIEFYSSKSEDGEYTLLNTIAYEDIVVIDENGSMTIPFALRPGYKNYFKIRSYISYGKEKVYSEYRKIIYDGELSAPLISKFQPLSVNADRLTYGVDIYLTNVYASNFQRYPTGVDVLYSTLEDGEYTLLTSVSLTDMTYAGEAFTYIANIDVPVGNKYFLKLRKYVIVDGKKVEGQKYSTIKEAEMYSITYNLDGGEFYYQEGKYSFDTYTATTEIAIANPRKDGHIFLGWTGSNGTTPEKSVTIPKGTTGNLEYTSNWVMLGDINEDNVINGKDKARIRKFIFGLETLTDKQKIAADVNLDGDIDDVDLMIIRKFELNYDMKLPYDSGEKYNIKYNLDGGTNSENNISVYAAISLDFELREPTKEGYVFLGWTGSNGTTPQKKVTITEGTTGNLEYTANWGLLGDVDQNDVLDIGDVTYIYRYINGYELPETIDILLGDVNLDDDIDDVDASILAKYISDGCKYNPEGFKIKLPYDSGEKYTIKYNLDGGLNDDVNISTYAAISLDFELQHPTKEGYVFLGWTGSNGTTPQKKVTITEGTTGNLEYTANWKKLEK